MESLFEIIAEATRPRKYITSQEVFQMAIEQLCISQPNVDREENYAEMLGLEWGEVKQMYYEPNY